MGGIRNSKQALTAGNLYSRRPGVHADRGAQGVPGLHLRVSEHGARYWVFRFQLDGRRRDIGIGSLAEVGLDEAREIARQYRRQKREGIDPLDAKREQQQRTETTERWTFKRTAEAVHETLAPSWKSSKHAAQWIGTLQTYAFPLIGARAVGAVGVAEVLAVLRPIWQDKPETARRVRQRIDSVMRWAEAHGHAEKNPVPAAVELLPKQKVRAEHHAAMLVADVPAFYAGLRTAEPVAGNLALRFAILTAARSGEVRGAAWAEIDADARVWTVPAARMKASREHRVPLSDEALTVLEGARALGGEALLFPSPQSRGRRALSDMTLGAALKRRDLPVTVHGFRSTFRDWCAEQAVPREVAERALAHTVKDASEAAYNRSDLLEQRRPVMDGWSAFLLS